MRSVAWPSAAVVARPYLQVALQAPDRVAERADQLGLDRVLDDGVTVGVDPREVRFEQRVVEGDGGHTRLLTRLRPTRTRPKEIPAPVTPARARINCMQVLDNPVWHALAGPQSTVAERVPFAARYQGDVSVFAALPDDPTPEAWDGLRELVGPGAAAFLARRELAVPDGWTVQFTAPCRQMWWPAGPADESEMEADTELERLGEPDVPEMLALVERTKPGPFLVRTVELGTYLGLRDAGNLIAMAGERMHPEGFTEISAVCTDSAHRGSGLASRLVRAIVRGIRDRAETPFLHLTMENEAAHRVYSALGFETRAFLDVIAVRAPD